MKNLLITWNGMAAKHSSGGDLYTAKFINYSNLQKDVILSEHSKGLISMKNVQTFFTDKNEPKNFLSLIITYLERMFQSTKIIRENQQKYNLCVSSSPYLFDVVPNIFARAQRKVVILFHVIPKRKAVNFSTWLRFFITNIEQKLSNCLIKKYFDTILTGNEEVKKVLEKKFPGKKIVVADAGININKLGRGTVRKNPHQACFIGRLTVQKGILDLVEVVKNTVKKHPKFKVMLLGEGPDKSELLARIKKAGLEKHIILKGFVSNEKKREILETSKFFLFPSYEEGWGIALAEALYHNCVGICYELPYYKSVFGEYPIYVQKGDVTSFSRKLLEKYKMTTKKDQRKFISKYEDRKVIKKVFKKLSLSSIND